MNTETEPRLCTRTPHPSAPSGLASATSGVELSCPRCRASLRRQVDTLGCTGCSSTYSVADGIFDLRCERRDYYFNPVPRPEMAQLTADAEHQPWPAIVRRFLAHVNDNPDWLDDLAVDARYAWKLFLDLPADARVLELGCGLGNLVHNLAPHVGEVVAFDLTWERLRFAKRRFERFNPTDRITLVAGGDGPFLPFPDAHFDCVTLSGVLEWVADTEDFNQGGAKLQRALRMLASINGEKNPRRMQLRFLREIRRVLKPGGQLFVAIENRLDYEYFGRRPDHHSGLWFGSLLPRPLANAYSVVRNRTPYRTYTYSAAGLERLFGEAGFPQQSLLGFLDGYTHLSEVLGFGPADNDLLAPPKHDGGVDRFRRHRMFVPAYGMIAAGPDRKGSSLLRRVVQDARVRSGSQEALRFERMLVSPKEKAVLLGQAGTLPVVMTIACNAAARAAQARHHRFLESSRDLPTVAALVPVPLCQGVVQNVSYSVEQRLTGHALQHELNNGRRAGWLDEVRRVVRVLDPDPAHTPTVALQGEDFERLFGAPLTRVLDVLDDRSAARSLEAGLTDLVRGLPVKIGLMHGDFSVSNLFVADGQISGLIDWEDVNPRGIPLLDAFNYLDSTHRHCSLGLELADTLPLLARMQWPVADEQRWLERLLGESGHERRHALPLAVLYWLWHVEPQLAFRLAFDRRQIARRIEKVARALLGES